MNIKKLLKRDWKWNKGSEDQKDIHIKKLESVIIQYDKRIKELEELIMK